jgi:arylsulfatase A-like enzyme
MSEFTERTTSVNRRQLVLAVLLLRVACFSGSGFCAEEPGKVENVQIENVLFIISDDLNNFLGCYGDSRAQTPNIDRLAARGVTFQHAYCTFPLCGPSRNSMLTGLYPNSTGIYRNAQIFRQTIPSQVSLPQAFRLQGYFAGRIGKLYHYNVPKSIGTNGHDDPGSWELELNPAGVDRMEEEPNIFTLVPGQFGGTLSWYASPKSDAYHTDGMLAEDARWVLERCSKRSQRPFFLAVGFYRPHTPYVAPKVPYFDWYEQSDMPLRETIDQVRSKVPEAALASYRREQDRLTDDLRQEAMHAYYASISFMDAQVGRVLDQLDELGLADTTAIVFTSDHGYHMGEHGLWQKMSLFEQSARVPLIIVAPGVGIPGSVVGAPVSHVDLYPTLLELCGLSVSPDLQGQSLVPMLVDSNETGRGWALTQVTRPPNSRSTSKNTGRSGGYFGYSLRTPRWRYTRWDDGFEGTELYDHQNDPDEMENLADNFELSDTIDWLSEQLDAAIRSTFPESGVAPELLPELWSPSLTNP